MLIFGMAGVAYIYLIIAIITGYIGE